MNHTHISPNKTSPRNHAIDTITIHCVVGQCYVESLGNVFASPSKQASSNYGIGKDGRIGMYVEEQDRSWCSSSSANDNRAITIEVASDTYDPYAVTDAAYKSLINLVTDICKRNGIKKLVWSTNKTERINHLNGCNMTVHRDYANKSCPGEYLYSRHGQIAAEVNKRLGTDSASDSRTDLEKMIDARIEKMLAGKDTKPSDWAKKELAEAVAAGITDGTRPGGYATREQVAAMVFRAIKKRACLIKRCTIKSKLHGIVFPVELFSFQFSFQFFISNLIVFYRL